MSYFSGSFKIVLSFYLFLILGGAMVIKKKERSTGCYKKVLPFDKESNNSILLYCLKFFRF